MRVFLAGATGVVGRQLVPMLVSAGHDVIGLARSRTSRAVVEAMGAGAVMADALDRAAMGHAVREAAPDVVVHMLTAIPAEIDPRHLSRDFARTNRLRTKGTRILLDVAEQVGVRRVIGQGLAYAYDPSGNDAATEDEPFWQNPPKQFAPVVTAVRDMEDLIIQSDGVVLRLGHLYGPGTIYAPDGSFVRKVRAGKVPVVGHGSATFSFTHTEDAASAVLAALDRSVVGALNVVDDEPARVREWLPGLARMIQAPEPRHVPVFLARMVVGDWGVALMTRLRGAENSRARLALDWRPRRASWRSGFAAEYAATPLPGPGKERCTSFADHGSTDGAGTAA